MSLHSIKKAFIALLTIRFFCALIYCFLPLNYPHLWRQTDTMAVAMRYWLRWTAEPSAPYLLLPAILNSGDTMGLMPMEFPLLNILTAPFFMFGPYWGRVGANIFLCFLLLFLVLVNYKIWKKFHFGKINAGYAILLLPMFSFANPVAFRFMPDFLSFLLCLMALGFGWNKENSQKKRIACFLLSSLGLLLKPTTIAIFFLILLQDKIRRKNTLTWFFPGIFIAFIYYTIGIQGLTSLQETNAHFKTSPRPVFQSLQEFFINTHYFLDIFQYHTFVPYALFPFIILSIIFVFLKKDFILLKFWIILFAQMILIAALDGKHAYEHYYYFISLSFPAACIAIIILQHLISIKHEKHNARIIRIFSNVALFSLLFLFICRFIDILNFDLHSIKKTKLISGDFSYCQKLIQRHPEFPWRQGAVFVSTQENFPALGLCFGERESSQKNAFGFFYLDKPIPHDCQIIDAEQNLGLGKCQLSK